MVIGITGPAGSGKSHVLRLLREELNVPFIDSDSTTKKLYQPGGETLSEIRLAFGDRALLPDGNLDRGFMAELVFHDAAALNTLNRITHPPTIRLIKEEIARHTAEGSRVIFVESAIAGEAGYREELLSELWLIYASEETRYRRLQEQRGYTKERIRAVFSSQKPLSGYLRECDRLLVNEEGTTDGEILRQGRILLEVCQMGSGML